MLESCGDSEAGDIALFSQAQNVRMLPESHGVFIHRGIDRGKLHVVANDCVSPDLTFCVTTSTLTPLTHILFSKSACPIFEVAALCCVNTTKLDYPLV
jgi:hypothetical protein